MVLALGKHSVILQKSWDHNNIDVAHLLNSHGFALYSTTSEHIMYLMVTFRILSFMYTLVP